LKAKKYATAQMSTNSACVCSVSLWEASEADILIVLNMINL
jgi:hypothetical protein